MMASAFIYNNRTPTDEYYRSPSPTTPLSPTPVTDNDTVYTERSSLKLSFPCGASNTLDSAVINAAGQSIYSISSYSKRTTMLSCKGNIRVATIQWDRHSPRMVFRRKKTKCKEWLKLAGLNNEYVPVSHCPF